MYTHEQQSGKKVIISTYEFAKNLNNSDYKDGVRIGILDALAERGLSWVVVHSGNIDQILLDILNDPTQYCGFISPGGFDWYNEDLPVSKQDENVNPARDEVDYTFFKVSLILGWPILGICRGFQGFSTMMKQKLVANVETNVSHARPKQKYEYLLVDKHMISIEPNSDVFAWLVERYNEYKDNTFVQYEFVEGIITNINVEVNTMHHQAIDDKNSTSDYLNIFGRAADQTIEFAQVRTAKIDSTELIGTKYDSIIKEIAVKGVTQSESLVIGAQWHPEAYIFYKEFFGEDHPLTMYLFEKFSAEIFRE